MLDLYFYYFIDDTPNALVIAFQPFPLVCSCTDKNKTGFFLTLKYGFKPIKRHI